MILLAFATLAQALKQVRNIQAQICILTYVLNLNTYFHPIHHNIDDTLVAAMTLINLEIPFFGKSSLDSGLIYCILAFWKKVRTETYATDSLLRGLAVPAIPLFLNGSLEEEVVTETTTSETPSLETSTYLTPDVDMRG